MAPRLISRLVVVSTLLSSAGGAAQEPLSQQSPAPVVTPTPTPASAPSAVPVPLATSSLPPRSGIDEIPAPEFVPNPRATPTPTPARPIRAVAPVAAPSAVPPVSPTPVPTPTPARTAIARQPIETVILPERAAAPLWPWFLGALALLLVLIGFVGLRRREKGDEESFEDEPSPPLAGKTSPVIVTHRARLSVALRPTRAGLNLISATAACEVSVANVGDAPAHDIHAALLLMSACDEQDVELAAFYADLGGRSATPRFALAPGEERRFPAVVALPHDAIHSIEAGGRPMFVPLLALSVRYRDGEGTRQIGQAFALGIKQGNGAKLSPLWLDGPSRSYDNVAARPHGAPVEN